MFINIYIFKYPQIRNMPEIVLGLAAAAYVDCEQEVRDVTTYVLVLLLQLWRDPLPLGLSSKNQFLFHNTRRPIPINGRIHSITSGLHGKTEDLEVNARIQFKKLIFPYLFTSVILFCYSLPQNI